jgi:hypothetical protein
MPETFSFKTVENGIPIEKNERKNLYQDQTVLIFNHPTDSSRSAAQTKDEFGLSKPELMKRVLEEYDVPDLQPEQKVMMTDADMREYQ